MPHLEIPDATLYYETDGAIGKPAVLLLHAGVATLRMWDPLIPYLAADHYVIRFDERGYGQTVSGTAPFSDRDDARELLDHLGVASALLIGGSRGGGIALDTALETPERASGVVTVCSGVGGFPELELTDAEERAWAAVEAASEAGDPIEATRLATRFWSFGVGRDEATLDPVFVQYAYELNRPNATHDDALDAGHEGAPLDPPAYERLGELSVPLLVIAGRADISPLLTMQDHLLEHVPGAEGYLFHDAAHLPSVERPEEFAAVLGDWMRRNEL